MDRYPTLYEGLTSWNSLSGETCSISTEIHLLHTAYSQYKRVQDGIWPRRHMVNWSLLRSRRGLHLSASTPYSTGRIRQYARYLLPSMTDCSEWTRLRNPSPILCIFRYRAFLVYSSRFSSCGSNHCFSPVRVAIPHRCFVASERLRALQKHQGRDHYKKFWGSCLCPLMIDFVKVLNLQVMRVYLSELALMI